MSMEYSPTTKRLLFRDPVSGEEIWSFAKADQLPMQTPRLDALQDWRASATGQISDIQTAAILLANRVTLNEQLIAALLAKQPRTGTKTTSGLLLNITKADTLIWPEPFPNNNYRVVGAVVGGSAGMPTLRITGHTAATVSYEVRSGLLAGDVVVDFIGVPY